MIRIDITGNWHVGSAFLPSIQTREPDLSPGELRVFHQVLNLPPGRYHLEFEYSQNLDRLPGQALNGMYDHFDGVKINGDILLLSFQPRPGEENVFTARGDFVIHRANLTQLGLAWRNSRVMRTWLVSEQPLPSGSIYYAIPPSEQREYLLVHGIPFLARQIDLRFEEAGFHGDHPFLGLDRGSLLRWQGSMRLDCQDAPVKTAHFLGMIHNIDIANGSWYSQKGDHGYSHFVGDQAGEIEVIWEDGSVTTIPLIFGFNVWYGRPWDMLWFDAPYSGSTHAQNCDAALFSGDARYRDILRDGLALVDGMRLMGSLSCNARFIFSLDLQGRAVRSLVVHGDPALYGYPLISAVTLETAAPISGLAQLPAVDVGQPQVRPVSLETVQSKAYLPGVQKIMHSLYTFVDELPKLSEAVVPPGYSGPAYDFRGTQAAVYAATYLYYNGPECAAYIADRGTGCSSSTARKATFHYILGMGVWREITPLYNGMEDWLNRYRQTSPGGLPGSGEAWSRGIGELLREALAFGYDKFVDSYIAWLDACLFSEANPPHWIRVVGLGKKSEGFNSRRVGELEEVGNRENDGHGICMWGRYMAWHWQGCRQDWNEAHFAATQAAVEWIQWQLDSDTLFPGARKDVLYTESECAHGGYEVYSSYNCLHGLKLSIRMAQQLERQDLVERWTALYRRLRQGILDHLVDETPDGPIWHTDPFTDWQDHAHKLVHLHLATEGDSYTPLQDYAAGDAVDQRYLEISRNTYRFLMKGKNYNCLRMYGYGQGMMTQAALLLDEMEDARQFLEMLLTHCYLPHLEGWAGPEGIIVHRSGKYYLPVNGYMGQDSHVADSTKALRLMLGVDDNDPDHLRLAPRYPADWKQVSLADYPALTGASRQHIAYTYIRQENNQVFTYRFERPVAHLSLRLGPLPADRQVLSVEHNGAPVLFEPLQSGDSRWVWVHDLNGAEGTLSVNLDG